MFRIQPQAPPGAYKTYAIRAPLATHWRPATCQEADCEHYLHGWQTIVPADSPAAEYIRHGSGRVYREERQPDGLVEFTFPPGQDCFQSDTHRVQLERPEIFTVRGGDWRGNPDLKPAVQLSPQSWTDDFGEHQERLQAAQERG